MRPPIGESLGKTFAELSNPKEIGQVVERAIDLSGRTKKALAADMRYEDEGALLSRWCSGAAEPQIAKLWAVRWFRPYLLTAMAEQSGSPLVRVQTTVVITTTEKVSA
jgi:hypothetical protein